MSRGHGHHWENAELVLVGSLYPAFNLECSPCINMEKSQQVGVEQGVERLLESCQVLTISAPSLQVSAQWSEMREASVDHPR